VADIETPISAFLRVKSGSYSYLLESADPDKRWGRYSFIGCKPFLLALLRNGKMQVEQCGKSRTLEDIANPLQGLRGLLSNFKLVTTAEVSRFAGGLVGYVNYDLIRAWEPVAGLYPKDVGLPECIFMAPGRLLVFDHFTHKIKVITLACVPDNANLKTVYSQACEELEQAISDLRSPLPDIPEAGSISISALRSNLVQTRFEEMVCKARKHIVDGEAIQVVVSQEFSGLVAGDDFALYRNLRSINPSPYMFYLNFGDTRIIGASPEILVRLINGKIELRPIAGTKPRGRTADEDEALEKDLLADHKERAEHIMLVDLARNDAARVAVPGSVAVTRLMQVERYSHVMHLVSHVEGALDPGKDCFDLFMSAFPAGTVTGAPKIRAMEIIAELEPSSRGPYAGAVGYFGFNGNMDFCITIRTIVIHKNKLSVQVGAGIVADSSPQGEYDETLRKAAAMLRTIEGVKNSDFVDR
jgi:anthranilate synthase component 1